MHVRTICLEPTTNGHFQAFLGIEQDLVVKPPAVTNFPAVVSTNLPAVVTNQVSKMALGKPTKQPRPPVVPDVAKPIMK